jgi:hypothetical protein
VGVINAAGVFSQPAIYNPASFFGNTADYPHSAYSLDGYNWYFGDTSGIYDNDGIAPITQQQDVPAGTTGNFNTISIKSFGSSTYALLEVPVTVLGETVMSRDLAIFNPPGPNVSTSLVTMTHEIGFPSADGTASDFTMVSSQNNGVYDAVYATVGGTIYKYGLVGGTWTAEGEFDFGIGFPGSIRGIAAVDAPGGGVDLYFSTDGSNGVTPSSELEEISDSAGFDETFAASTPEVLYTAATGMAFDGVSMAPVVPEPAGVGMLAAGGLILLVRRRVSRRS